MINKYIVLIEKNDDIKKLKQIGVNKFIYPLKSFSIGFNNYFDLSEITYEDSYLYINKLLDSFEIEVLEKLLHNLPENIKGIIYDDIGITEIVKDLNIEKIMMLNHLCASTISINEYLNYCNSVVLSNDITLKEMNSILEKSNKSLCIYGYGYLNISYSKRILNTNYSTYHKLPYEKKLNIKNTDFSFFNIENEDGTVIYNNKILNILNEKYVDNIKYFIINLFNIDVEQFINEYKNIDGYKGFLDKKTIYKLKEDE